MYLVLPFTRLELQGWGALTRIAGIQLPWYDRSWRDAGMRTCRGKLHGYRMELRLADWSERLTYFLGRYYELGVQETVRGLLRPGDRFVDIGANIGMITLLGASAVGTRGRVDSFEPNPEALEVLRRHIALNDIQHVRLHPIGLADAPGQLTLNLTSDHTGTATLTEVDPSEIRRRVEVEIAVGDDRLLSDPQPVRLIKIDVEGFELQALRGLRGLLERDRPFLITEFVAETYDDPDAGFAELVALLGPLGYRPHGIHTRRRRLRHGLHLTTLDPARAPRDYPELLWARPEDLRTSSLVAALD